LRIHWRQRERISHRPGAASRAWRSLPPCLELPEQPDPAPLPRGILGRTPAAHRVPCAASCRRSRRATRVPVAAPVGCWPRAIPLLSVRSTTIVRLPCLQKTVGRKPRFEASLPAWVAHWLSFVPLVSAPVFFFIIGSRPLSRVSPAWGAPAIGDFPGRPKMNTALPSG
jgi:hypothetical protein